MTDNPEFLPNFLAKRERESQAGEPFRHGPIYLCLLALFEERIGNRRR
jgi:hypothetical protein